MLEQSSYVLKALLNLVIALFLVLFIYSFSKWILKKLLEQKKDWFNPITFKGNEIISSARIMGLVSTTIKIFQWFFIFLVCYLAIPFVLNEIPATHEYAVSLLDSIKKNFKDITEGIMNYIPSLFFIGVVIFLTRSLIRFLKFIFLKIEHGLLEIDGFYPEWASTTFNLIRFIVCIFAFVIIYPYLPGAGSRILEGISVFLGIIVSVSSGSAISNLIAGIMINYMRPFRKGDYIKIGDAMGMVIEKGTVVTKLLSYKNEEISIPNTQVLNSQIYNYSAQAQSGELILYVTVTIGYDITWIKVYEMLFEAASKCDLVNQEKKPFILQTNLNEKNVSYQLNAYTNFADKIPDVYSQINQYIQEVFAANQVELLSPSFMVIRSDTHINPVIPKYDK